MGQTCLRHRTPGATTGLPSSVRPRYDMVHEPEPYDSPAVMPHETTKAICSTAGQVSTAPCREDN